MPKYTEEHIKNALLDVESGESLRTAARKWGVPRSTLRDRFHGTENASIAHGYQQRLSPIQEKHLRDWVLTQAALGLPPTHLQLRTFTTRVLAAGNDLEPLGKHWVEGFLRRNPEIKTVRGKGIDSARINGASTDKIKEFFALLNLPAIKKIPAEHRHNMDEIELLEGFGGNGLVIGSPEKKIVIRKQLRDDLQPSIFFYLACSYLNWPSYQL